MFVKDPDAKLDYGFTWGRADPKRSWLAPGEVITNSTWIVPAGLTKVTDSFDDTSTTVWIEGGVAGESYEVVNHVVTSALREDDRTIEIAVRSR